MVEYSYFEILAIRATEGGLECKAAGEAELPPEDDAGGALLLALNAHRTIVNSKRGHRVLTGLDDRLQRAQHKHKNLDNWAVGGQSARASECQSTQHTSMALMRPGPVCVLMQSRSSLCQLSFG